jgi:hypothetical protein
MVTQFTSPLLPLISANTESCYIKLVGYNFRVSYRHHVCNCFHLKSTVTPCNLVEVYWYFRGTFCLHLEDPSDYTASHPRRQYSSYSLLWKPQISFYVIYIYIYIGIFMVYFHKKSHAPNHDSSLVVTIKWKGNHTFHKAPILILHYTKPLLKI